MSLRLLLATLLCDNMEDANFDASRAIRPTAVIWLTMLVTSLSSPFAQTVKWNMMIYHQWILLSLNWRVCKRMHLLTWKNWHQNPKICITTNMTHAMEPWMMILWMLVKITQPNSPQGHTAQSQTSVLKRKGLFSCHLTSNWRAKMWNLPADGGWLWSERICLVQVFALALLACTDKQQNEQANKDFVAPAIRDASENSKAKQQTKCCEGCASDDDNRNVESLAGNCSN